MLQFNRLNPAIAHADLSHSPNDPGPVSCSPIVDTLN